MVGLTRPRHDTFFALPQPSGSFRKPERPELRRSGGWPCCTPTHRCPCSGTEPPPHWLVQVEADLLPIDLANAVLQAWRQLRCSAGAADDACQLLALGGRKDDQAASGALLQRSDWGVDVVETLNAAVFLQSINWELLKQGRAPDGVFELYG